MSGWIKLHRSLLEWDWYGDINATRLLIHLLLSVNYEDKKWRGQDVKAGSIILSWETLSKAVGLSVKQCRTAMQKLENSGEVARQRADQWQVITLCKWDKLQGCENDVADKRAVRGQTKGRQRATTKEYKEIEERKEDKESLNYVLLLQFINKTFNRKFTVISESAKRSFNARLKEGYTKEHIMNAILSVSRDQFHIDNKFKFASPDYFSRSKTLDQHGNAISKPKLGTADNPIYTGRG